MNIWSKLEVSGIFENAWAHLGMLRNPWRCLRTLRNTQECAGLHVEALGAVRSTQLQFWVPHENDQPSLGIVKTHLESFGRVWHAQEYEGMHCCCAWLRMPRFPFPCCTGFSQILGPIWESFWRPWGPWLEGNCERVCRDADFVIPRGFLTSSVAKTGWKSHQNGVQRMPKTKVSEVR